MREKIIEHKLVKAVKAVGGICPKFTSPGLDGMPDRLVLLKGGRIAFVELKCTGGKLRHIQIKRKGQLELLGFKVYVVDDINQIETVLNEIGGNGR